nr:MAG TPA_asm: hypothetical protein [Caudoviricetes sp.]
MNIKSLWIEFHDFHFLIWCKSVIVFSITISMQIKILIKST